MSRRRKQPQSDGGYYVAPGLMQLATGLPLSEGHRSDRCIWCRAHAEGRESNPCPDRTQLELFGPATT